MKKILIVFAMLFVIIFIKNNNGEEYIVVPKESIRFRIIPNSNSIEDIYMKELVKEEISTTINSYYSNSIENTRNKIKSSVPNLYEKINTLFNNNNYKKKLNIEYGDNYFPEKIYKGIKYPEGTYESIVVTIGKGSGDNFWCVLFPPLCLIESEESDTIEYKFFIKELIDKYFL